MIDRLQIDDLGVIEHAEVELALGFTAVTGETGAGKTMVVTALGMLLGQRVDAGSVRLGAKAAVVEGTWLLAGDAQVAEAVTELVDDLGGTVEDGELILSRQLQVEGRTRAVIGGRSAPVGSLRELGGLLVAVHGQSDQQRLRGAGEQLQTLDRFAGGELSAVSGAYAAAFQRLGSLDADLAELSGELSATADEIERLRFVCDQIAEVNPVEGEDDALAETLDRLRNADQLRSAAATAHALLSGSDGDGTDAVGLLGQARQVTSRVSAFDTELGEMHDRLADLSFRLADVAGDLASYVSGFDEDSARQLAEAESRAAQLSELKRLYGPSLAEVIVTFERSSERLSRLDDSDAVLEGLQRRRQQAFDDATGLADQLGVLRRQAALRLERAVADEFEALAMPGAALLVEVAQLPELTETGRDRATLLLQPHPGAEPRPIAKGASGGELSRIMLAIEVALADSDPVPTFIFDEVDAGVGGASAVEIGRRLAKIARNAQVIVVTHLPQVAAFADRHIRVLKNSDGGYTASSVVTLNDTEREQEIARMLSGRPDSVTGLAHAREMLDDAQIQAG